MSLFLEMAWTVLCPILLVIATGAALGRAFRLDADTMGKLNLYAFVPALLFVKFTESTLAPAEMGLIAVFWTLLVFAMLGVAAAASRLAGVRPALRPTVYMGAAFTNSGNFGLPAAQLAFGPAGAAIQAVILTMENVLFFTLGVFLVSGGTARPGAAIRDLATDYLEFLQARFCLHAPAIAVLSRALETTRAPAAARYTIHWCSAAARRPVHQPWLLR